MAGQGKDQFEGFGELADFFRKSSFFNPESAQQQNREEARRPIAEQGKNPTAAAAPQVVVAGQAAQQGELEKAINHAIKEAAAKGGKLAREQALKIGEDSGVNLNQYDHCGISPPHVFYTGNEPPVIKPNDVPLAAVMAVRLDEPAMCADHQALMVINLKNIDPKTHLGRYIGWEAVVINKWEELDAQKAHEQLRQPGYNGIELLTFSEAMRTERGQQQKSRDRQALLFSPGTYSPERKQRIMALLRGEAVTEKTQAAAQPAYSQQAVQQPQPAEAAHAQTPAAIGELLPKGSLEEILTVKILYEGKPYEFLMPVLLNEFMAIDGEEGYRLAGKEEVTFTGKRYVKDAAAREEVERTLIAKDKRLRLRMSPEQQKTLETALQQEQNPAAKQSLIRRAISYVNEPGSGQQTL